MRSIGVFILLCFVVSGFVLSQENENESWYSYWAIGYAMPSYTKELDFLVNLLEDQPGVIRMKVDIDMLGVYLPVYKHKTAAGFVINAAGDRLAKNNSWVQINQYLFSLSAMHFPLGNIGKGIFVRADVGYAFIGATNSFGMTSTSKPGYGFLVGGGYGFPVSPQTRLLINANYSCKKIEGSSYTKFNISVGGLF